MEDYNTIENIINQMKDVEKNNWSNMEFISGIDLLLTSNNNGTDKDEELSQKFYSLREKMQEVIDSTNDILTYLNEQK
ncbi:hypothetical protein [Caldisalinibacter kiritimatiensis]|uniref:Uncharacterized protein n=1 Tax=Caldisalinibacter kiritimatiensis TaxID=1304284 RepID=R1AR63_9FIRM|nr:hypothetical protein [Caldisalinibacter kiritimatiensis]EOC99647.1 hypothetical protein L21TH_2290 [Caldisalinibacter kiritimatiensis]